MVSSSVGELRNRIETDADGLVKAEKLSEADASFVTKLLQHTPKTRERNYVARSRSPTSAASAAAESQTSTDEAVTVTAVSVATQTEDDRVTVAQFESMLKSREHELKYTDTGRGWAIVQPVKPVPIDEVMSILRSKYSDGALLTAEMIADIDWMSDDCASTDFRGSAIYEDNIVGQLTSVLMGKAVTVAAASVATQTDYTECLRGKR
jgi:hypothetical protein